MANPQISSQPILLFLVAFLSITPPTHSLCSHSIITALSSSGFTHFAHALHSHNLSAAGTTRATCFVFPDSAFLGRPVSPNTVAAHVLPSLALPLESLLRLRPHTVLPTLRRTTTLVSGTDGKTVLLNNVPITAPNLHVDDSCVVHGVEGPLIDDDDVTKTKINVTTPRRRSVEVVRFIRRSHGPVLGDQNQNTKHP